MPASTPPDNHAAFHEVFRWHVPTRFNLAEVCCNRWALRTPEAVAIVQESPDGEVLHCTYAQLKKQADRLSLALRRLGVRHGDRVALILPQRIETAVAYIAIAKLGAVSVPLSILFGPEALEYRLQDSGAIVALIDESAASPLRAVRRSCPALRSVVVVGTSPGLNELAWRDLLAQTRGVCVAARTHADDPAILIYTSGTTGPPKGALIPHRALIGNLPGFVCSQNGFGALGEREVFWSPADWAWTGGLMDALLPTLYFGRPIVAYTGRFEPQRAFELLARHGVTHTFLFPTALKAMMKAVPHPRSVYPLALRAVMSAGEAVGDTVFAWCRDALGVPLNEMFGQTEINYVIGNCDHLVGADGAPVAGWPARAGSMGRPYPGHRVAVLDEHGRECPPGVPGDVAVHRLDHHGHPDPVFFLGYWRNDEATRSKFTGDPAASWCCTGDTAVMDADGYLWYQGRSDDVFKVAGYRIGPSEIENCLVKHSAVANAAVVPKPDPARGALVKAYVVLAAGHAASTELVAALQEHVRGRLAPYEYPKEIEFVDALPMTTTGKIQRRILRLREAARAQGLSEGAGSA